MSHEATAIAVSTERRILRRPEVEQKTGCRRAHLYTLIKAGNFPKPVRVGIRAVGWDSREVEEWIEQRRKERA